MLRDRLVCGIADTRIQQQLLAKKNLTYKSALEIAQSMETAAKNMQTLQGAAAASSEPAVHKVSHSKKTNQPTSGNAKSNTQCYRCGQSGHVAQRCRFRTAKCHHCGKTGHIKAACRSAQQKTQRTQHHASTVKTLEFVPDLGEYELNYAGGGGVRPIKVDLEVDGQQLSMEVDTGASLSLVSETIFRRLWPSRPLQPTTVQLKTYSGELLPVLGTVQVHVSHGNQTANLPLLVVQTDGPSLLGRNWLEKLQLDWQQIHQVHGSALDAVLHHHSEVFQKELGLLKGYKAKLSVDVSVTPVFCKARPVPYSMLPLVEKELEQMVQQEVLEPVQFADWAAPIVPILKPDKKSLRICGDFKMTVNQASKLDAYPIPKVEDLFAKLSRGKHFSKLDLSQAFLQLELDEHSKQYVVVNTHKGLFQFNRLPYGISSSPGIFQRTMDSLLQGIPGVVSYIDDILITGATEEEHLLTLDRVLERLETAGLRLNRDKCVFLAETVVFLGHKIDQHGLHPTEEKVRAVQAAPKPHNVAELKAFLGLLTYYGKFIPNLSTTLAPLYRLLRTLFCLLLK